VRLLTEAKAGHCPGAPGWEGSEEPQTREPEDLLRPEIGLESDGKGFRWT